MAFKPFQAINTHSLYIYISKHKINCYCWNITVFI